MKPPIILHNRPKVAKAHNLLLLIDNENVDDPARYKDSEYTIALSKNTIVYKDDESTRTIKMIEIDTSGSDIEVTWLISYTKT